MKMPVTRFPKTLALALLLSPGFCSAADVSFSLGVKPQSTNWTVTNTDTNVDTSARATQAGLGAQLRIDRFYGGLALSSGQYTFDGPGPERPDGQVPAGSEVKITRGELDLVFGYYFWRSVSVFADLKSISSKWEDSYQVNWSGIGLGINGNKRFNAHWGMFGSLGLVPMRINDDSGKVGTGRGRTLEAGALYALNAHNIFTLGLKNQGYGAQIDADGDGVVELKQWYRAGSLVFNYYYTF